MSAEENIRLRLSDLLERHMLPRSICSRAFLQVLRPLLHSGGVAEEKSGAGRRLVVRDPDALREFVADRYPDVEVFTSAPHRILGVARYRNSKTLVNDASEIVCARAWKTDALRRARIPVDAVTPTREHGVFAFCLSAESSYSLHGTCALVENPVAFALIEKLRIPIDLALYGRGRISSRFLDWLAKVRFPECKLLHFPDYDPVGLSEFARLRARLGDRVALHLPGDLPTRFARFSKRSLLREVNNQTLLRNLRTASVPEIRIVVQLIDRHNAGLEQEALFLDAS